jgi:hypothetical protein
VTAQRLCESYQRALAANGGEDTPAPEAQWQVRLRAQPGADPGQATTSLEAEVFAAGRWLGQRTLAVRPRDCGALPDALALVLLLLAREAPPAPPPTAARLSPSAAGSRDIRPPGRGSVELGAGAGLLFGTLPAAAFALQLEAATLSDPISLRLRLGLCCGRRR